MRGVSARRFWIEAGDPIKGQRLSRSKGAKAVLVAEAANEPTSKSSGPRSRACGPPHG